MRNLKKILALVLALVMSMSLVTVASASYADEDTIDARYAEAVEVLSDMGIFKGYEDGTFNPKGLITREEVATMMYRVISKDVTDTNKGLFVEAAKFSDVASTKWSAGYIGYCYNGNYVKGYEDGTFGPAKNVTGYEVLAMILRAVGYDQKGEFSGSEWKKNIGTRAQQLGILNNVAPTVVLSAPATRELVAELIFRTMATVDMVEYTPAFDYQPILINTGTATTTLGLKNFGLDDEYPETIDYYGRPGYTWTYNVYPYETIIEEEAAVKYVVPVTECQLATDLGISRNDYTKWVDMYVDGSANLYEYQIDTDDIVTTVGGQGTRLEVYSASKRLVVIHTWLAQVTNVTPVVRDAAGHLVTKAHIDLNIYDQADDTPTAYGWDSTSNFNYAVGDYVLVETTAADNEIVGTVVKHNKIDSYCYILGKAPSKVGAQTYIWFNADKHTISGVDYNDAEWYRLDAAGESAAEFMWLFDNNNNVIGSVELPAAAPRFAIIENIQWINPIGAAGYAQATLRYIDNTTEVKTIKGIDANMDGDIADANETLIYKGVNGGAATMATGVVSDNYAENTDYIAKHLYQVIDMGKYVNLVHVNTAATANENGAAKIYNSSYAVPYTAPSTGTHYINEDTVFMVKKGNTWELVTGYKNVSTYTNGGAGITIDWLQLDTDPYLEFVFLGAVTADSDNGTALFFRTSDSYRHHITAYGTLCEVTGLVDGVEKTLVEGTCLCTTTKFVPYTLTLVDGAVTAATVLNSGDAYGTYTLTKIAKGGNTTWNGVVLNDVTGGVYYNVLGLYNAPTYGTWAANLSNNDVWVLWKADATTGDKVAAAVYIIPNGTNATPNTQPGTPVAPAVTGTLSIAAVANQITATYTNKSGADANNVAVVWEYRVAGTETWSVMANSTIVGPVANNASADTTPVAVPTFGGANIYEVRAKVGTTIVSNTITVIG